MRTYLIATIAAVFLAAGSASAGEPGAPAPAANKTNVKNATGTARLKVRVEPASRVFVDGADKGKVTELELPVKPGAHIVRFVHDSGDEHEDQIVCQAGKTTAYEWKFDYSAPAAADLQDIVIP